MSQQSNELERREPERSCVGCREPGTKEELERFIYHDEVGLVYDLRKKAPGRGAYLHPVATCVEQAGRKGGFSRAFKRPVPIDAHKLIEEMRQGIFRRLQESLRVAFRAQHLFIGATAVADAMKNDRAALVVLASDASEGTRAKFSSNAQRKTLTVRQAMTGEQLGAVFGREFVALVAVAPFAGVAAIGRDIDSLERLKAF